jgi:putative transport protein
MLAGLHTQPAVLSYAVQQAKNDLPNVGYAATFPMATIADHRRVVPAQLLLPLL